LSVVHRDSECVTARLMINESYNSKSACALEVEARHVS
jgi:hypothetical protein